MAGFESLAQILPRAVKTSRLGDELLVLQVRQSFLNSLKSIFKQQKLPKITAGKFSFGTLTILVPDSAWSAQLRQAESQIIKKINSEVGHKTVERLQFRVVAKP